MTNYDYSILIIKFRFSVYYRIHVPQKIKTIYHTKIIKVPEHHHYIHEKTKLIKVEPPHHEDFEEIKDADWAHSENHNTYKVKTKSTSTPRRKTHKRRKVS